jgi:hypothetical protein
VFNANFIKIPVKIPSSDNCCHLGMEMNSRFKATERTTNACRKVRNVFFAINGIMSNSTKPCVLVTFYKSVVLKFFSRGFSENCNMYDLFGIKAETPFT